MAAPKITLTDAVKSSRVQKAIGLLVNDDRKPATIAQIDLWLVRQLRAEVLRSELTPPSSNAETAKREELKAEGW